MDKVSTYDEEKFTLMTQELQKLKSQIFYMQQSFLQMRGGEGIFAESDSTDNETISETEDKNEDVTTSVDRPRGGASTKVLAELRREMELIKTECVPLSVLERLRADMGDKEALILGTMTDASGRLDRLESEMHDGSEASDQVASKLNAVAKKLDHMEAAAKKYNLILVGLPPERRLERPKHVEQLVLKFLKETLKIGDIAFDEAERKVASEEPASIVVRFPNVREKIKVLQASRERATAADLRSSGVSIREDFTDRVLAARKRLAAFARRRAKRTRSKWALRYDELYFNGRVFVFEEATGRVTQKGAISGGGSAK